MVDRRIDGKHLPDGRAEDAGTLSSLRLDGGMMAGEGGVMLPFVGVGGAAAVGEVVAGCGMEKGPVSPAAGGGDAGVNIGGVAGAGTGSLISRSTVSENPSICHLLDPFLVNVLPFTSRRTASCYYYPRVYSNFRIASQVIEISTLALMWKR
jgi:hypothetical protein